MVIAVFTLITLCIHTEVDFPSPTIKTEQSLFQSFIKSLIFLFLMNVQTFQSAFSDKTLLQQAREQAKSGYKS